MSRRIYSIGKKLTTISILISFSFIYYLNSNEENTECVKVIKSCETNLLEREKQLQATVRNLLVEVASIKHLSLTQIVQKLKTHENVLTSILLDFKEKNKPTKKAIKYSCPETYKGSTFGYPYFTKGFLRQSCTKIPIRSSTSIVFDRPSISNLSRTLDFAQKTFKDIFIVVDKTYEESTLIKYKSQVHRFENDKFTIGESLNNVLKLVTSPFVLIAPHLGKFDNTSDIERLLHVHEISGANFVGGAVKNINTGEWDRGCYQMQLKLYTFKISAGYHHSDFECLNCEYLVSPFLANTEFLKELTFQKLNGGVYHDLFLRLKQQGKRSVVCPDVMFYLNKPEQRDYVLTEFANVWDIKRIINSDKSVFWYGCRKGFSHTSKNGRCSIGANLGVPPCCLANLADAIKFILKQCNENDIQCELQEGTLMGAVKFNNMLPWERDADITVLSKDFRKFKGLKDTFIKEGYQVSLIHDATCCFEGVITGGTILMKADGWTIEIYGQHKLTSNKNSRTKITFDNDWFAFVPENPGLYIRNRYGKGIYKHAEHWMATGKKSGWDQYNGGSFSNCNHKGHHACLDQFDGDGDIQFQAIAQ